MSPAFLRSFLEEGVEWVQEKSLGGKGKGSKSWSPLPSNTARCEGPGSARSRTEPKTEVEVEPKSNSNRSRTQTEVELKPKSNSKEEDPAAPSLAGMQPETGNQGDTRLFFTHTPVPRVEWCAGVGAGCQRRGVAADPVGCPPHRRRQGAVANGSLPPLTHAPQSSSLSSAGRFVPVPDAIVVSAGRFAVVPPGAIGSVAGDLHLGIFFGGASASGAVLFAAGGIALIPGAFVGAGP